MQLFAQPRPTPAALIAALRFFARSLGAADLLFCVAVLPFAASRFLDVIHWEQYPALCSMVPFLQYGNVGVSLLFISMITINRQVSAADFRHQTRTVSGEHDRYTFIIISTLYITASAASIRKTSVRKTLTGRTTVLDWTAE